MNLLEQNIERIISEKSYKEEWTKAYDNKFVRVNMIVECYGSRSEVNKIFTVDDWEGIKKQGFYLE